MEVVKQFNQELSSLYETKPPISKAKMTSITKTAIKAIKFYKHVVQSVEKFIQKCKPEYKVPGLYVIDSIVRQSRHQFGSEKDVFAPRFARNILQTFVHLFNCPVEDKSKVIRVLNLWQKNAVFGPEVIQPLFDLADPNHPMHKEQAAAAASNGLTSSSKTPPSASKSGSQNKPSPVKNDTSLWVHEQAANTVNTLSKQIQFDKKLLDFDYGEEDDDAGNTSSGGQQAGAGPGAVVDSLGSILSNPEVLRQLQNLQAHLSQAQLQKDQVDVEEKMRRLQEMKQQEEEFDRHLAQTVPKLPFAAECDFKPGAGDGTTAAMQQLLLQQQQQQLALSAFTQSDGHQSVPNFTNEQNDRDERRLFNQNPVEIIDLEKSESPHDSMDSRSRRRRRSSSRTATRNRSRSRSHSRSKKRRSRSWDRDKDWKEDREHDREKERERKKKGLPPLRRNHLSVCSTTLWIGHLSKLVQQEELSDTFGEFGDIVSIDLIPPRGCAFICMNRRQDANKALTELKYHKLHGKTITLAWAPGKGMKGKEWKDFWEVELGVSYIPWNKLSPDTDFELLEEGGMLDEDTMPVWMKEKLIEMTEAKKKERSGGERKNFGDDNISQEMGQDEMMSVTPSDIPIPGSSHPGFIPLPDGPLPPTSTMGDIKPPMSVGLQMPPGPVVSQAESSGMAQLPTHLPPMSIMSPFGMPRLLMGHGMLGNVPLGVPPPGLLGSPMMLNRMPQPVTAPFNPSTGVLSQIPLPSAADKQKAALSSLTVPPPGGADGFGDGLLPLPFALPPHLRMQQGSLESSLLGPPISGTMDIKVDKMEEKPNSDDLKNLMHNFDIPPPNIPGLFGTDTSVPPPSVNNLGPQPLMGDSDQRILLDQLAAPSEDKDDRHKLDRDKENDKDRDDRSKDRDFRNSSRDKENKDKDYRDRKERDHRERDRDYRDKDRDYRGRDRDRERDRDHRGDRERDFRLNRDGRNDGMRDGRDARNDLRDRDNRDGRDNRNNRDRYVRREREDDRRGRSRERRDKPSRWSKDDDRRDRDISNENDRNFRNAEGISINPRDDKGRRDKSPIRDGERHLMPGRSDENERDPIGRPLVGPPGNMNLGPPPNGFLGGPPARHPPLLGPPGGPLFGPRGAGPDGPNFRPSHPHDDFDRPPLDLLPPDFRPSHEDFNEFDLAARDRDDFPMRDRPGFDQRHPPPRGLFEDNFGPPGPFESRNRPDFFPHGMRGPGPIGPGTRGIPPLMGTPPGIMGLMFPPRGPMGMRGAPRPGIWLDPPGGPNGFPSRGPPPEDMFLGPPFEEPPFGDNRGRPSPWMNREDDRRRESEGSFSDGRHGEFREGRFEDRPVNEDVANERLRDMPGDTVSETIKEQAARERPEGSDEPVQPVVDGLQLAAEQSELMGEQPCEVVGQPSEVTQQPSPVAEQQQQVDEQPQLIVEQPQQIVEPPQQIVEPVQKSHEQMCDTILAMSETFEQEAVVLERPADLEPNSIEPEIQTESGIEKSCEMPYSNVSHSEEPVSAPEVSSELSAYANNNQETESMNLVESNQVESNEISSKSPISNEIPSQSEYHVDSQAVEAVLSDSAFESTPSNACFNTISTPEQTNTETALPESCLDAPADETANESVNESVNVDTEAA